jgi:DNA-binding protein YbaB
MGGGVDARIEELHRLKQDVDAKLGQVRDLTAELRGSRFEATAGKARAVVDGQGALVDLHIDDDAVGPRVAHPGLLGQEIVEAVAGARRAAAGENARRFHAVLPEMVPAPDTEARPARPPVDDDEDFDPFFRDED